MPNPVLIGISRFDRLKYLDLERRRRKSGDWGAWETLEFPDGVLSARGWLNQVRQVRKNKVFSVLIRPHEHGVHLAVSSLSGIRPTWHEMQRIKNDVFGAEATAVEIYPPQSQLVDEADMFHIWSVDPLPFTLFVGRTK
jgi:hypothetical protein